MSFFTDIVGLFAGKNAPEVRIAVINVDCPEISAAEIKKVCKAITRQCREHFALPPPAGYGISASLRSVKSIKDAKPWEWQLLILAEPDVDGALGYHDQTPEGLPVLKIFPRLDAADGVSWSGTASHEVLETLADPNCAKAAQDVSGKFWAYEVCDGVEATSYWIDGVEVSNFELPPYFEPVNDPAPRFDWLGLCKKPMEILKGGYNQYFAPGKGWQQVVGREQPRKGRTSIRGRSARRRSRA